MTKKKENEILRLVKRIEAAKTAISKERDKLRGYACDLEDILNSVDDGLEDIQSGVEYLQDGITTISETL